jgi:uncharacterized protein YjbJ (UPF0337 family)
VTTDDDPVESLGGGQMTESAPGMGSESTTSGQVKEQVREKAQVAQDKAKGAADQARGRLGEQVDQRSTQAGERVSVTAGAS